MEVNPEVKVTKLDRRPDGTIEPEAKLGAQTDEQVEIQTNLTGILRSIIVGEAKEIFLLEWEGSKVPYGAVINGKTIGWTRHSRVVSDKGEDIGNYQRTVEFGGASGKEHKMLVFQY